MTPKTRSAIVRNSDIETVRAYLPANYLAYEIGVGYQTDKHVLIVGTDDHGWTLDGYVIPRLASGLIVATEVTE